MASDAIRMLAPMPPAAILGIDGEAGTRFPVLRVAWRGQNLGSPVGDGVPKVLTEAGHNPRMVRTG